MNCAGLRQWTMCSCSRVLSLREQSAGEGRRTRPTGGTEVGVGGGGWDQTECNGGENEMGTAGSIDPPCGRRLFSQMAGSCPYLGHPCARTHTRTRTQAGTHSPENMLMG